MSATEITVDIRMFHSSGIGTYISNLLPLVIQLLPDIKFNLLCDVAKIKNYDWTNKSSVNLINCNSPIYSIAEQFDLIRKTPKSTDLFWSPHYNIPVLYRGKLIVTVHDLFHIADENDNQSIIKKLYAKSMLSKALRKSQIVFTVSNFTLSEMKKYKLPALEKVKVIHNGASYKNTVKTGDNMGQYILFVGNVKPHKNIKRLVAAYKILHTRHKIILPLVIVGETEKFITGLPGFRDEIYDSSWGKWIKFTGRVSADELIATYRKAAILVLPSLYEGFGLPPLEAMACGCPVVVSQAASLPEVCGDAALYCDPLNVDDIASKIHEVLSDNTLRKTLITRGYDRVNKFDWNVTAQKYVEYIESLL